MRVYISYASPDKKYASLIEEELKRAGHTILFSSWVVHFGDNLLQKINDELKKTDALIVIVSKNSLQSKSVMQEYSAMALGDLSNRKKRVVPVLVDDSSIPQYLTRYACIDLTKDSDSGIKRILSALSEMTEGKQIKINKKRINENAISVLFEKLKAGRLTLVCGAGISIDAGIPSWNQLLVLLLKSMIRRISRDNSIALENVTPEEYQKHYGTSALMMGKYLKSNLGNDFMPELRDALYSGNPTSCENIDAIVELARPQRDGKSIESIITFNFDGLVEEQLKRHNIRYKSIFSEGMRSSPNELPVYHVHGFLPRKGRIEKNAEVVFSEDAYHSQFLDSYSWSNLIQLNKLSQNTCLFIGLSLTDPNLRRLLDVANRKNPERSLNHFIIKKTPAISKNNEMINQLAMLLEERDANDLGLNVIWVETYADGVKLLRQINRNNALSKRI